MVKEHDRKITGNFAVIYEPKGGKYYNGVCEIFEYGNIRLKICCFFLLVWQIFSFHVDAVATQILLIFFYLWL